jgi:hypothetical protein
MDKGGIVMTLHVMLEFLDFVSSCGRNGHIFDNLVSFFPDRDHMWGWSWHMMGRSMDDMRPGFMNYRYFARWADILASVVDAVVC